MSKSTAAATIAPKVTGPRACRRCRGWGNHHGDLPCTRCASTGSEAVAEARAEAIGEAKLERAAARATKRVLERIEKRLERAIGRGGSSWTTAGYATLEDVKTLLGRSGGAS